LLLASTAVASLLLLTGEVEDVGAELLDVVEGLSDLLVGGGRDGVEPVGHEREDLLLGPIRLLHLDDVPDDVLRVLHVDFQQLDGLALGLHFLEHLRRDDGLQVVRPVVSSLLRGGGGVDHTVEEDLDDDEEVLVGEEHEVL